MMHRTEKEFLRIIEELKRQEDKEAKRQDQEFSQIVSAMRLQVEGEQQLSRQISRLIRSTTLLAGTQIALVAISIIVAIILSQR